MKYLIYLIFVATWMVGIVLANGFWSTLFAITIPFYAIYLAVERVLLVTGFAP